MDLLVPSRCTGPPGSGNGGWVAGSIAAHLTLDADLPAVTVRLSAPVPLETPLHLVPGDSGALVARDGATVVASAAPAPMLELEVPAAVSTDAARAASVRLDLAKHPIPECFVCGPARAEGDGLRVFAGPVEGREGVLAAPVVLPEGTTPLVWAALDCPGAFAVGFADGALMLLGTITAQVHRLPEAGRELVVQAWEIGREGRKRFSGTALYDGDEVLARAHATWIEIRR